jgi:hypothetical protein
MGIKFNPFTGNFDLVGSAGSAPATWGSITGTLSAQTDLQSALDLKANLISPSFTTPNLGTPSAGVLTNATGLPIDGGTTGTLPAVRGGTGTASNFTTGSIVFAASLGVYGSDPTAFFWNSTTKRLGINTVNPISNLHVVAQSSSTVPALVQGVASQSADLQQWRNNVGGVLANINSTGLFRSAGIDVNGPFTMNTNSFIANWTNIVLDNFWAPGFRFGSSTGMMFCSVTGPTFNTVPECGLFRFSSNVIAARTMSGVAPSTQSGFADFAARNYVVDTVTGSKFGTATNQKIGFWNAIPSIQPTTAVTAATFTANTSAIADDTATFDGYTIGQVVKALRNIGLLA